MIDPPKKKYRRYYSKRLNAPLRDRIVDYIHNGEGVNQWDVMIKFDLNPTQACQLVDELVKEKKIGFLK